MERMEVKPDCLECWATRCITMRTVLLCRWCAATEVAIPHVPTRQERDRERGKAKRKAMVAV